MNSNTLRRFAEATPAHGSPEPMLTRMLEGAGIVPGTRWEATLIQAGLSANNVFYPDSTLREAAGLFHGARIFAKGDSEHLRGGSPDVNQLIGWVDAPRFVEGVGADAGRIVATVCLPGLSVQTRELLINASRSGQADIVGFSIDAIGESGTRAIAGQRVAEAKKLLRVQSVDLICEPGAGGRLVRLIEAAPGHAHAHTQATSTTDPLKESDIMNRAQLLALLKKRAPGIAASLKDTATDAELELALEQAMEAANHADSAKPAIAPEKPESQAPQTSVAPAVPAASTVPAAPTDDPAATAVARVEEAVRMAEARIRARELIAASKLPQAAKDRLQADFAGRTRFAEADVAASIKSEGEYLARFVESGRVSLGGLPGVVTVEDRADKVAAQLDAFFDPEHREHRSIRSFKEAYIDITGDRYVTGRLQNCDPVRMRESLGRFAESLDSGSFALMLGDALARRVIAGYNVLSNLDVWRPVSDVVPINDFRENTRVSWGGYGDLPVVAEGDPYQPLNSPADEAVKYKPSKRGGTEDVTLEMIKNDDVGVIRQIPGKLVSAAKRTLSKFVLDFLQNNPNLSDGNPIFSLTAHNLGAFELTAASWSAARKAMMKQREAGSNARMGIPPAFLLIPADLEEVAFDLFKQRAVANDPTFPMTTAPTVLPVWYWEDEKSWIAVARPSDIPVIEVGFLDDAQEPTLFLQDSPTVGSVFTHDKLTYKIRHIYGGTVLRRQGVFKSLVP